MENEKNTTQADGRIVRAVRNLRTNSSQKNPSDKIKDKDKVSQNSKININPINSNNPNIPNNPNNNRYESRKPREKSQRTFIQSQDKVTTRDATPNQLIGLQKTTLITQMDKNKNEEVKNKENDLKSISSKKIKLKLATPKINAPSKVFDYETLKRYNKNPKTEYQKNILSENNIIKYKEECINILKKDKEIKQMLDELNIIKDNNYLQYLNDNFFSKQYFLITLEMLILENVNQSNTLKVFRTNKTLLPLKTVKENFFKDEFKKDLEKRIHQARYNKQFKQFNSNLNTFISDLNKQFL